MSGQTWDPGDPLARVSGESAKAHRALVHYACLGVGRSLARLIRVYQGTEAPPEEMRQIYGTYTVAAPGEGKPPTVHLRTVEHWSSRWQWQGRVAAWDIRQLEADLAQYETAREEWRQRRADLLAMVYAKVGQAVMLWQPDGAASLSQIVGGVREVLEQSRTEFDDLALTLHVPAIDRLIEHELERIRPGPETGIPASPEEDASA